MRSHASEKVLADRPKNELRTAKESEVIADFISSSPSRRPWWLCAEVVLISKRYCNFRSILLSWSPFAFYTSTL